MHSSAALQLVHPSMDRDLAAAEIAAAAFLRALGISLDSESLAGTPARMARGYAELFTPRTFDLTTFPNDEGYDELVVSRNLPLRSVCEHHMLPFVGNRPHRVSAPRAHHLIAAGQCRVAALPDHPAHVGGVDAHRVVGLVADIEMGFVDRLDLRADAAVPQQIDGRTGWRGSAPAMSTPASSRRVGESERPAGGGEDRNGLGGAVPHSRPALMRAAS